MPPKASDAINRPDMPEPDIADLILRQTAPTSTATDVYYYFRRLISGVSLWSKCSRSRIWRYAVVPISLQIWGDRAASGRVAPQGLISEIFEIVIFYCSPPPPKSSINQNVLPGTFNSGLVTSCQHSQSTLDFLRAWGYAHRLRR